MGIDENGQSRWTETLTGSSVAAIVVSAAAAAYWSQAPAGVGAASVMQHLDDAAKPICARDQAPWLPELILPMFGSRMGGWPPHPLPQAVHRRITVCGSLGRECAVGWPWDSGTVQVTPVTFAELPGGCPPYDRVLYPAGGTLPSCDELTQVVSVLASPFAGPQPENDPCGSCGFVPGGSGRLVLELDPTLTLRGQLVKAGRHPMIELEDVDGDRVGVHLGEEEILSGSPVMVDIDLPPGPYSDVAGPWLLTMNVDDPLGELPGVRFTTPIYIHGMRRPALVTLCE